MENKATLDKGKLIFTGPEVPKSGTTTELLKEGFKYSKDGWKVLYLSESSKAHIYGLMNRNNVEHSDTFVVRVIDRAENLLTRITQLCEEVHPDVLIADAFPLGVNELRRLSELAKEKNILVKIGRTKQREPKTALR